MNFLRTYSYTVQRYCSYNSINGVIRRCNHTLDKQKHDVPPTIKSTIYPDYTIIYKFSYISCASILNKLKYNYTVFVGASIPVIGMLTMQDFMSVEDGVKSVAYNFMLAATMHIICKPCNDLIGVVYYKEDDNKVIISYVNYWGKRVDLLTDIYGGFLQNFIFKMPRLYRKLYVKSHEKNFKIFMKSENIIDKSSFSNIFGDVN